MSGCRPDKKSAVTLVELIFTIMLVGLIFVVGIIAIVHITQFFRGEQARHRATDDLALVLNWIQKDAIQADLATVTDGQLTLRVTDYTASPPSSTNITYSLNGTTLSRVHPTEGTKALTDIIDAANPPQYSVPSPPNNYLLVDIRAIDAETQKTARQRTGVMLRCRDTGL